jgi:hypothetical protein
LPKFKLNFMFKFIFLNLFQILPEFKLKFKFKFKIPQIYSKFEFQVRPAILSFWFYSKSCTNSNSSSILNSAHMSPCIDVSGWAHMSAWSTALVVLIVKNRWCVRCNSSHQSPATFYTNHSTRICISFLHGRWPSFHRVLLVN